MGLFDFFRRSKEHAPENHDARRAAATSSQMPPQDRGVHTEVTRPQVPRITHEVHEGETLWDIAQTYYGEGNRWREIYRANEDVVTNPDRLTGGLVLRIPVVKGFA